MKILNAVLALYFIFSYVYATKNEKIPLLSQQNNLTVAQLYNKIKKLSFLYKTSSLVRTKKINHITQKAIRLKSLQKISCQLNHRPSLALQAGKHAFDKKRYTVAVMCYKIGKMASGQITQNRFDGLFSRLTNAKSTAKILYKI